MHKNDWNVFSQFKVEHYSPKKKVLLHNLYKNCPVPYQICIIAWNHICLGLSCIYIKMSLSCVKANQFFSHHIINLFLASFIFYKPFYFLLLITFPIFLIIITVHILILLFIRLYCKLQVLIEVTNSVRKFNSHKTPNFRSVMSVFPDT